MNTDKPHTELHDILTRGRFAPMTRKKYENVLDLWIEFAGTSPRNWTRMRAQEFYSMLRSRMQANSANVYMASLKYVSKWYSTLHDKPSYDFATIQTEEPSDAEKRGGVRSALTEADAEKLIRTCDKLSPLDRRDLALIVMGLETGMRRKSLAGANVDKIGTPNGYPSIVVPIKGRGGDATYCVPLSDTTIAAMTPWRAWLHEHKVNRGPLFRRLIPEFTRKNKRAYLVGDDGISEVMIAKVITARAKLAKIQHVHPHLLRHTFITWREIANYRPEQIASITGHKQSSEGFSGIKTYFDMAAIGATVRNSTPTWLVGLVDEIATL